MRNKVYQQIGSFITKSGIVVKLYQEIKEENK